MSKLQKEAEKLSGRLLARRQKYLDALIESYERDLERFTEIIPQLRAENWQRLAARRGEVEAKLRRIHEGIQGTKQMIGLAQAERSSLEVTGAPDAIGAAEAKLAEQRANLAELNEKQQTLRAEESDHLQVVLTWRGTKAEFEEALLSPNLLLDRCWAELQLRGPWRELPSDAEVGVRYQLESGAPGDWWPRR